MAAEFAYIFKEFGSKVTLICRSAFLKSLDNHLRALARKELQGVEIRENSRICSFNGDTNVASVQVKTNGQDLASGLMRFYSPRVSCPDPKS